MAASSKPRSNTSKKPTKGAGFQFRWWMVAVLVAAVAVIGIVVIRFSRAGIDSVILRNPYEAHNYGAAALQEGNTHHFF